MLTLGDFSRLVSAIHAAAITPQHWIAAMEALRVTFGSTSAALITADGTSRVVDSSALPQTPDWPTRSTIAASTTSSTPSNTGPSVWFAVARNWWP